MAGFRRLRSGDSTAYFAHCHYLVFIEDVSGKTGPQRWRPLSSNGKLIDEKALIGHGKKAVKVNLLPHLVLTCWLLLNYHRVAHFLRRKSSGGLNLCDFRAVFFK